LGEDRAQQLSIERRYLIQQDKKYETARDQRHEGAGRFAEKGAELAGHVQAAGLIKQSTVK
jgi:hypothetical protein